MSKLLFWESNQAFNEEKPFKHKILKKESSYKGLRFFSSSLSQKHTLNAPLCSSPHIPITPTPLYTLTFTTRVPAQDLSFFSFSIFPYIEPAVLLAPAGGSCFFFSSRLQKLDVNTVRSAPLLHALTLSLAHTPSPLLGRLKPTGA